MALSGSPAADDWRLCHVGVTQNGSSPRPYRWAAWDAHGRKTKALCQSSGRLEHTDRTGRRCSDDQDGSRRSLL